MTGACPSGFRSLMDWGEKMGSRWCKLVGDFQFFAEPWQALRLRDLEVVDC